MYGEKQNAPAGRARPGRGSREVEKNDAFMDDLLYCSGHRTTGDHLPASSAHRNQQQAGWWTRTDCGNIANHHGSPEAGSSLIRSVGLTQTIEDLASAKAKKKEEQQ